MINLDQEKFQILQILELLVLVELALMNRKLP